MFQGKTLLITGGTGSFGNAVLQKFINTDIKEIRVLSRDEKKQDASVRFVKYMLSTPVQERILKETEQVPANPHVDIS